ncbi:MAG: hypothetical protein CMM15_10870 [Rhodospirillaceae bacterium]|nr:hypothetical protein [Rhodospirillaceae bacterium]OUX67856.1 MAG: hypothetical protein CBD38_01125 [bacterium TMED178]
MPCGYCAQSRLNESEYSKKLSGYKKKVPKVSAIDEQKSIPKTPKETVSVLPPVAKKPENKMSRTTMTYGQFAKFCS